MSDPVMSDPIIKVVIPALNEQEAIGKVVGEIPSMVSQIIVVDNGSTDDTALVATKAGAKVISVPRPGYGRACLAGIAACQPCDIIVFLDGDASDYPGDMPALLVPILQDGADLVIGSRRHKGLAQKGSLTTPQRFGNALACWLMARIWGAEFTDLGPFRAVRMKALTALDMSAPTFGWTVEMQVRALKQGLNCAEVPVRYKKRIGKSKISGTVSGVVLAGAYILGTIAREALRRAP